MKKSLETGLFLIKKENLRLKEENSKLKARVENIENKLREAKLFELLFPVVVASMLTVWGYAFLFFFDEFVFEESQLISNLSNESIYYVLSNVLWRDVWRATQRRVK